MEIYCLRAALTPAQSHRQKNIRNIEEFVDSDALKLQADSRLLELSQIVSNPQAEIDMLLSISGRYQFPDMIERVIPLLRSAANRRDYSLKGSNHDIANFLEGASKASESFAAIEKSVAATNDSLSKIIDAFPKTNHSVTQGQKIEDTVRKVRDIANDAWAASREAYRSQIRLTLARALIMNDSNSRNRALASFSDVASANDLKDDAQRLLNGISRITPDEGHPANLKVILEEASKNLVAKK